MFSRFFIDRPIFATVLSVLITLAGAIAVVGLPLSQYPSVTPPTVEVACNYPGASAQVVAETIGAPIEQKVTGVEDMLYMSSQSTNDGSYGLTVTFKPGVNLNLAQVLVQNRVNLAIPSLPEVVRQTGVTTKKRSPDILLTVSLNSPDGRYDQLFLSNFAVLRLVDELARIDGISEVRVFGQRDYSMRIWLDPDKLAARNLMVSDVVNAIREQNAQVALGQVGQEPAVEGQMRQIPLSIKGRLQEPEEFGDIVIRATPDQRMIRIRDVARVEINSKNQDIANRFDGKPTVGLAVFQLPDANALATADRVKEKMKELYSEFPEGAEYEVGYDTTPFIRESVEEVFKALRDSIVLVALVVLIFLQGWRPAIIPLIAVPVAIVGTFAALSIAGFSLNNLTLFGLVLAIGIVVDDAIVVVEAVEQFIEKGLSPREAAIQAMEEVAGPIIAVGVVLTAVFVPCTFIAGVVGQFFKQFALTIAISTIISTLNSLTLSPALAALLLRSKHDTKDPLSWLIDFFFGWFFRLFNIGVVASTNLYVRIVWILLRIPTVVLIGYVGLLYLTYWGFNQLPTGFIPVQDKGYLVASVQMPDATAAERTRAAIAKIEKIAKNTPGVKNVNSVAGNSFLLGAYGSNFGSMFIILESFHERRHDPNMTADKIIGKVRDECAKEVPEALVNVFPPPAVAGLGRAGGFRIMIEDRGDLGLKFLEQQTANLVKKGNEYKDENGKGSLTGLLSVFKAQSPQLYVDVNREECLSQGVELSDLFATLQTYLGSRYVNDFNRYGRTWQVIVQADSEYRNEMEDVARLQVRNKHGQMVPLGALCKVEVSGGPLVLTRYNMYPAASINGNVAPGVSSGQGIKVLEEIARAELPQAMAFEWTEITYLERLSGNTGLLVFILSVIFVFLVLAALYESWAMPLAVILVVPMCVLCAIAGVAVAKMDINIFTQIGFVVLIGLACKNAILIVEFAKLKNDAGMDIYEATLDACRLRLRPILMTSFAFILGVVPLVIATGAGAEMRRALGTAVFSGMLGVTLFGIFLTPVFFLVMSGISHLAIFRVGFLPWFGQGVIKVLRFAPLVSAGKWVGEKLGKKPRVRAADVVTRKPTVEVKETPVAPVVPPTATRDEITDHVEKDTNQSGS